MNHSELGHRQHKPMTEFGMAVQQSGFGRVCPTCYKQWSDEIQWLRDTDSAGDELSLAGATRIRRHPCGGEMLPPGLITRLAYIRYTAN